MLEHENIDPKRPLHDYVLDKKFSNEARELSDFISSIKPKLRAYCYQYPTGQSYTCWYVGFADRQNPYILHFDIKHPKRKDTSKFIVWFRRPEYNSKDGVMRILSSEGYNRTKPDQNFRYMYITELENDMKRIITDYVKTVRTPLIDGKLRPEKNHKKCQIV